jgi:hypothetical protein
MINSKQKVAMTKLVAYARANVISIIALFVALGGSSYAAIAIPRGSVGTAQLKNHSVTPIKLGSSITGVVRAWAYVGANGTVYASQGVRRVSHFVSSPNTYGVLVKDPDLRGCAATASVTGDEKASAPSGPGSALADLPTLPGAPAGAAVTTFNATGQPTPLPFLVEVLCDG